MFPDFEKAYYKYFKIYHTCEAIVAQAAPAMP